MQAMICQGNGKYYLSTVYGYYKDINAQNDYDKYLQEIYNPYWIVWDEKKEHLIKWHDVDQNSKYIIYKIIIIDSDQTDWILNEEGEGCVNFLSKEIITSLLNQDINSHHLLSKCLEIDKKYIYKDKFEINNSKDIEDLKWATREFHDAEIIKEKLNNDGSLYLKFSLPYDAEIEIWFWGNLEYNSKIKNIDSYFMGVTITIQGGFIYFVEDLNMKPKDIKNGHFYIKARHMQYKIIPI